MSGAPGAAGVRALFFAYFAYVGLLTPYLSLWFADRGLSIGAIALLLALPQAMRIVAPPFWGWLADRSGRRVVWLRLASAGALLVLLAFPWAHGVAAFAVLMLLLAFLTAAQGPIGEALALQAAAGDAGRYGRMRLWGSVGFVVTVLAGGPVLDALGLSAVPWLLATAIGALLAVTVAVPEAAAAMPRTGAAPVRERLREPAVVAFLLSAFLMIFAHAALYAFFSLFLERHGYSRTAIGAIWALGVVAEIALFVGQRRLFDRAAPIPLLAVCFAVCALRFALVGASAGALWIVVVTQLMHAITFGLHHSASMAVLHRWFDPSQQARAQAAFIVVAYGLGGTVGSLVAGTLWERVGPPAAFFGAAAAAAGGLVAVWMAGRLEAAGAPRPAVPLS